MNLSAILINTEDEAEKVLTRIDQTDLSEFEYEASQKIKYEVLQKTKGEQAAHDYLEQNISNPEFRRQAIQKSLDRQDFNRANYLAQEGIQHDMQDKPGLAKEWYDWLLKIAQAQDNTERIIEYARYLFSVYLQKVFYAR